MIAIIQACHRVSALARSVRAFFGRPGLPERSWFPAFHKRNGTKAMACVTSAAANWYHTLPSSGQGGRMFSAGQNLRALRESLGLKMRDVEGASARIARKHQNEEFAIPPSRLSDIETKGVVPSIYRVYALAVIYRRV